MLQLPVISNGSSAPSSSSSNNKRTSSSLPLITNTTSSSNFSPFVQNQFDIELNNISESSTLPKTWTGQHLQENAESSMTKLEWENQIARHILSMFATTKLTTNKTESKSLLDFVDRVEPNQSHLLHTKPAKPKQTVSRNEVNKSDKPIKKLKKKKRLVSSQSTSNYTASNQADLEYVDHVLRKLDEERRSSTADPSDKYRISNTIKTKDGKEIVVRGTPRCYPIWYVSTGTIIPSDDNDCTLQSVFSYLRRCVLRLDGAPRRQEAAGSSECVVRGAALRAVPGHHRERVGDALERAALRDAGLRHR